MKKREYSAGMVKYLFWFLELKKTVQLLAAGKTREEIIRLSKETNLFSAPSAARGIEITRAVIRRSQVFDEALIEVYMKSDVPVQKLITLYALMEEDLLFFEFMYEVYREKLLFDDPELADMDINVFFKHKQEQSEKVAAWTEVSLRKLRQTYKRILEEAGLITWSGQKKELMRPLIDSPFETYLKEHKKTAILKILTGAQ